VKEISIWFSKWSRSFLSRCPAAVLITVLACSSGLVVAQQKSFPPTAQAGDSSLVVAKRLFQEGRLEEARQAVLDELRRSPGSLEGYELLGIIYSRQKDFKQAITAFEQALKIDGRLTMTHNNLGNCYLEQQKYDMARKQFEMALRLSPHDRDAAYNLGVLCLAEHKPEQAIRFFEQVQPSDPGTKLNLTRAFLEAGQTPQGLDFSRRLSQEYPNDVRLQFSLGVLLAAAKQYPASLHELELANALQPGTPEILYNLGQVYYRNRDYAKAENALEHARKVQPDSAGVLYLLGQAYYDDRKDVQALELLLDAHRLAPKNTDVISLLARLSMIQNFHEDAIPLLEEGIQIDPKRPDLHSALGNCYFTTGKTDRAIQEFQTLIQLDPSAKSYGLMGVCYRQLGRYDNARKFLLEGLQRDPHNAVCLYNLGVLAKRQGKLAEAERYLSEALRTDPDHDGALYELASVKVEEQEFGEAIPLLQKCVKSTLHPSEAYYKLAIAERKMYQMAAAERDFQIFQTLAKSKHSGGYPFQNFFEFLDKRDRLPERQRTEVDLQDLLRAVEERPGDPKDLYLLAQTYLKLGRINEAKQTISTLDEVSGKDFRTSLAVGVILARYRVWPEAIQHFQAALAADPSSDEAKYDLADAFYLTHEYDSALHMMEKRSPQALGDDANKALLGDIYAHVGRENDAIKLFRELLERSPDNENYCFSLSLTQLRAGDSEAAEKSLRKGLERIPDSGRIQWGLGVVLVVRGDDRNAEQYLNRALDLIPEWPAAYSALGMFYFESGQLGKARATLGRLESAKLEGGPDIEPIKQVLAAAGESSQYGAKVKTFSPEERKQFLQSCLTLAEDTPE
jgi:tetratricopeptide (TPR) repeat protein